MDHISPALGWSQDNDSASRALSDSSSRCLLYLKLCSVCNVKFPSKNIYICSHETLKTWHCKVLHLFLSEIYYVNIKIDVIVLVLMQPLLV